MSATACERTGTELVAFLDDELGPDERRPVAEHLADCLVCRREMDRLATLQSWLGDLPKVEPSPTFAADFARRLAAEPTPIASRRGATRGFAWMIPALAAAAVLALALRSFLGIPGPSSPAPEAGKPRVAAIRRPAEPAAEEEPARVATRPGAEKPASPTDLAAIEALRPEDLPPELREHPELFLRLPVVRRLDTLEYLGSLHQQGGGDDDGAG